MDGVISLAEFREKRLAEKAQSRDFWVALMGPPATAKKANLVHKPFPMDPSAQAYFKRGASDARSNRKFKPPAANSAEYAYGYLGGIIWRDYRAKVAWLRVFEDVLDKETFEDELEKRPKRRPRLLAKRLRDVCVKLEIMTLSADNLTAVKRGKPERLLQSIVHEVALKYERSDRTVWSVWGNDALDYPFHKWIKRTATNSHSSTKST